MACVEAFGCVGASRWPVALERSVGRWLRSEAVLGGVGVLNSVSNKVLTKTLLETQGAVNRLGINKVTYFIYSNLGSGYKPLEIFQIFKVTFGSN